MIEENYDEEYYDDVDEKNDRFISYLFERGTFMFDWHKGAILPLDNPNYYFGRVSVSIKKGDRPSGTIQFEKDTYPVTEEKVNKLYNYIESNLDRLIKLTLNQTDDHYFGGVDQINIKYKSLFLVIRSDNSLLKEEVKAVEEDIKNILISE